MQTDVVPALSIQQPFAEAILAGRKSLEIRAWQTAYRGYLVVHAGQTWYGQREHGKIKAFQDARRLATRLGLLELITAYPRGAIVGMVDLIDCHELSPEEWESTRSKHCTEGAWHPNRFGWELRNPRSLRNPVQYRGTLGLFSVPASLVGTLMVPG